MCYNNYMINFPEDMSEEERLKIIRILDDKDQEINILRYRLTTSFFGYVTPDLTTEQKEELFSSMKKHHEDNKCESLSFGSGCAFDYLSAKNINRFTLYSEYYFKLHFPLFMRIEFLNKGFEI